ncbi:unnamed protein product [Ophioblennius macclurei]
MMLVAVCTSDHDDVSSSSSSSSSSSRWSLSAAPPCRPPPTDLHPTRRRRSKRRRCDDEESVTSPPQGLTSAGASQTVAVESRRQSVAEGGGADGAERELFWRKHADLQRFVSPLAAILHGLRSGRYSQRLSSFQESVAMDRIQRILGVLQNPDRSAPFLAVLPKVEELLQRCFPQATPTPFDANAPANKKKCYGASGCTSFSSSTHLKWLHTSPICSPKMVESSLGGISLSRGILGGASPTEPVSTSTSIQQVATQDCAVSSSTDCSPPDLRLHGGVRSQFRISSPCLERLLLAEESAVAPRTAAADGRAKTAKNEVFHLD